MILIWQFGDCVKIAKLTYAIIDPFVLQAWVSLHTVLKTANLKSCQQRFLNKLPNIMYANNSAYMVYGSLVLIIQAKYGTESVTEQILVLTVLLNKYWY